MGRRISSSGFWVVLAAKDYAFAAGLPAEYLAYTSTEIDYYAALQKQIFGREIAQVTPKTLGEYKTKQAPRINGYYREKPAGAIDDQRVGSASAN